MHVRVIVAFDRADTARILTFCSNFIGSLRRDTCCQVETYELHEIGPSCTAVLDKH